MVATAFSAASTEGQRVPRRLLRAVGELVGEGHGGQRTNDGHHRDVGDGGRVGEGLQEACGSQGLLGAVGGDDDVHQRSPNLSEVVAEPEVPADPDLLPKSFSAT